MTTKKRTKHLHEGEYVVEVDVELIVDDTEWSPHLSLWTMSVKRSEEEVRSPKRPR